MRWDQAEIAKLEDLAGNVPAAVVIESFQRWAEREGKPSRSANAIEQAVRRHGLSLEATGEWLTVGGVAGLLGVSIDVPQRWIEKGLLPVGLRSPGRGQRFYVRRTDLVAFARKHPALLGGIPEGRLVMALEDEELAAAIAGEHRRRPGKQRRVRIAETGKVFPSVRAAATQMHLTRQAIQFALRTGGTAAGWHWEEVSP